ncbi:myrosinase 1 [Ceratitis capitata]|uniref:myrosinase 1 n=1 Tax=Ceratitis capitata TaxID=7213 RepID=UPI00032A21A9|nr:myrosinase 1 [Ceratitis capitata]
MKIRCLMFLCLCSLYESIESVKRHKVIQCKLKPKGENFEFPKNFAFGVATSAYQIEGAWNEDGKAPSVWDIYTHDHPESILDHSAGDDAAESYHRFDQDLAALKDLKVNFYRFSITWSRVLPNGDTTVKNQKAIDYYNMVIDKLLQSNIEPMVTMFHYDMPDILHNFGGFSNNSITGHFVAYADFLYETFGDRVKKWITFNGPYVYCIFSHNFASYPHTIRIPGVEDYISIDNILKAHALAYRKYKKKYFSSQRGKVGITLDSRFYYNKDDQTSEEPINRIMQYGLGWLANPIFGKTGNYPAVMIKDIGENSHSEGLPTSRLPVMNETWTEIIKGSGDFLALNYYTSMYSEMASPPGGKVPSRERDSKVKLSFDDKWTRSKSDWLYCVPQGMEDLLKWVKDSYNNVEVYISENGWSDDGQLNDSGRIDYLQAHLQAVLNAINDGCNVTHYSHWSLVDNFEWNKGYTEKFGLYYLNRSSPNKDRIAKQSARYYRKVIETHQIPLVSGTFAMRSSLFNCILAGLLSAQVPLMM